MDRTPQRLAVALAIAVLAFAGHVGAAAAGDGVTTDLAGAPDPPLVQADTLTLHSSGGDIQAVVYQGNEQASPSVITALSGFTAPAGPLRAKTTYIVADGQTGIRSGGSDTLSFAAGGGALADGPDAFPGGDPCPWGPPSCLWDTRTFDVSAQVAPGDTTATVRTARPARGATRSTRSNAERARSSIRRSSMPSPAANRRCARSTCRLLPELR